MTVIQAHDHLLGRVLDRRWANGRSGLTREAFAQFHAARTRTAWGGRHQQTFALVRGDEWLAAATCYQLAAVLDGARVRVCAIGSVVTDAPDHESAYASTLVEQLLEDAARDGADLALLFCNAASSSCARNGFELIPATDVELNIAQSARHGAPMTLVRGGEDRDLAAIVAMGRARATPFRFHLDRDVDLVKYAVTTKRLLAGLGTAGARQLHFFIAEEGITAAAYVVISVAGNAWTLEECGDRDVSGARVGAILQALIAREPVERRPTIRGWLPPGFVPPQVAITSAAPSENVLMLRPLRQRAIEPVLSGDAVLYWRGDIF